MDKILVIDNIEQNVDLMVNYLRNANYDIITATDGASGIRKAKMFKPDLVVMDLIMPRISGYDVCKILKSDDETKDIILLVVTSMPSKESRTRAFEMGADEYMEKTFDKGVFLAKIKSLLRVKYLSDKLRENYSVLEEQNKQFEIQLEMAKNVQRALISEYSFTFNDMEISTLYCPSQGVSGDLYDVVFIDNERLGIFVSDVSGHGVSAALLTSMMKIMIRNLSAFHGEPGLFMQEMNEQFCRSFSDSSVFIFACAFYAVINQKEKTITYSNAGGSLPLHYSKSRNEAKELNLSGKPLGILNTSAYQSAIAKYGTGDLLFFQTDGLCDSMYKEDPETFVKKASELLADVSDEETPMELSEIIHLAMSHFYVNNEHSKTENDDVSIVLCRMD